MSILSGVLSLVTATLLYSLFGVLARYIGYSIPLFYQNVTRELTASAILVTILLITRPKWPKLTRHDALWMGARSLSGTFAFLSYYTAITNLAFGTAYFLFYGAICVFGFILAKLLFRERITAIRWLSLALALTGLFIIFGQNFSVTNPVFMGLALVSGFFTAIWNVAAKKVKGKYVPLQLTFVDNALPVFFYTAASLLAREQWTLPQFSAIWIANLSYGGLFVATGILVVYGFSKLDASIGSLLMLGEVLFAILLGYVIFHENLPPTTVIGGLSVITGMVLPETAVHHVRRLARGKIRS